MRLGESGGAPPHIYMDYTHNYQGYEDLSNFPTEEALESYRDSLIAKTTPQIRFIRRHFKTQPVSVVEIGCGNGRLLVGLANVGLLRHGVGLDISQSRIDFGRKWVTDWKIGKVDLYCRDVLKEEQGLIVDLAVCITGCFQYFRPIGASAEAHVLNYMRNSGRYALFELYKRPKQEYLVKLLPPTDPYSRIESQYDDMGDYVQHTKVFHSRDGGLDIRTERLYYYTMSEFLAMVKQYGFRETVVARENSESMVVLVR